MAISSSKPFYGDQKQGKADTLPWPAGQLWMKVYKMDKMDESG